MRTGSAGLPLALLAAALDPAASFSACPPDQKQPRDLVITGSTADPRLGAISGAALSALDGRGLNGIASEVSGLTLLEAGPGINKLQMRGFSSGDIVVSDVSEKPLVGVYLDEVPLAVQGMTPDLRVFDLERIDIVRGPNGTRSGAAALAGMVRFVTAKPDPRAAWAMAEAGLESSDTGGLSGDFRATANLPLGPGWAVRGANYARRQAGFIDNIGRRSRADANSYHTDQQRLAIRGAVGEQTIVDLGLTHAASRAQGLDTGIVGLGRYRTSTNGPEGTRDRLTLLDATVQRDLGWSRLMITASHVARRTLQRLSPEARIAYLFTSYPPYYPGLFAMPASYDQTVTNAIPAELYQIRNRFRTDTQEIRLTGDSPSISWTAGLYRSRRRRSYDEDIPTPGLDRLSILNLFGPYPTADARYDSMLVDHARSPDDLFTGTQGQRETELAFYGDATWHALPHVDLAAGLRLFRLRERFDLEFSGFYGVDPLTHQPLISHERHIKRSANPRLEIAYRPDGQTLFYAEAARGLRAGGVNQPVPTALCAADLAAAHLNRPPTSFAPDHAWTYEVGTKARSASGAISVEGDAFLSDWRDVQNRLFLGQCSYYVVLNQGRILSRGLELRANWRPVATLDLAVDGAFTNARAHAPIEGMNAIAGDPLPYSPRWIAGATLSYRRPIGNGLFALRLRYRHQSAQFTAFNRRLFDFATDIPTVRGDNPAWRRIPPSSALSAWLSYRAGSYRLTLFAENLTNQAKVTGILPKPVYVGTFQAGDQVSYARPRTVGLRLRVGLGKLSADDQD